MAKKKRGAITTSQVISTLVYIRNLSDALIATLLASAGTDVGQLPPPVTIDRPYTKDCPPPPYRKDCAPPSWRKDCPPPDGGGTAVRTRVANCPTYQLVGPVKVAGPAARRARKR
jgi:hypothetical protein